MLNVILGYYKVISVWFEGIGINIGVGEGGFGVVFLCNGKYVR